MFCVDNISLYWPSRRGLFHRKLSSLSSRALLCQRGPGCSDWALCCRLLLPCRLLLHHSACLSLPQGQFNLISSFFCLLLICFLYPDWQVLLFQGHFCPLGSPLALPCPTGQYQPNPGSDNCIPCRPGFYCEEAIIGDPRPCPPHSYCPAGNLSMLL